MNLRKAAEQALETLERLNGWLGLRYGNELTPPEKEVVKALRQALEQPEQEPVAWVYNGILHEFDPSEFATSEVKPLYTAPPKREWVGLTDDDLASCLPGSVRIPPGWKETARAIAAKLKEKNNG